jgi:hypothetical protein
MLLLLPTITYVRDFTTKLKINIENRVEVNIFRTLFSVLILLGFFSIVPSAYAAGSVHVDSMTVSEGHYVLHVSDWDSTPNIVSGNPNNANGCFMYLRIHNETDTYVYNDLGDYCTETEMRFPIHGSPDFSDNPVPSGIYHVTINDLSGIARHSNDFEFTNPTQTAKIVASSTATTVNVGTPFTVDVVVDGAGSAFNAAQANVAISSNLVINNLFVHPSSGACDLHYTQTPTTSNPSFAGAIFGTSTVTSCKVYTLSIIPTSTGTGSVTISSPAIKSYANSSELTDGSSQTTSFTINPAAPAPTPPGTTSVTVDDTQTSGTNHWDFTTGNWSHCTTATDCNSATLYNDSASWDNTTDEYTELTFSGIQVKLYGLVDPSHGIGAVSIDSGTTTNVDFYSSTRRGNALLWTSPFLAPGSHTLRVKVTGTHNANSSGNYVVVDRADVLATTGHDLTITNTLLDTYADTVDLTGTKDTSLSSIFVNGSSAGTTYPTGTSWLSSQSLSLSSNGVNTFNVYGKDDSTGEQTGTISMTITRHNLGDINNDGVVDLIDASLFAVDWGKTSNLSNPLSDMNSDDNANLTDFSILAKFIE